MLLHESFMLMIWVSIERAVVSNGDIKNLPKYHRWIGVDNGEKSNEFDSYDHHSQTIDVTIFAKTIA